VRPEHGVKFLCDRCKTRYSIGDDRVRGKILKIRCKNCANVITVREGMNADPDAAPIGLDQPRGKKATTAAPEAMNAPERRSREDQDDRPSGGGAREALDRRSRRESSPRSERATAAAAKEPAAAKRGAADDALRAGASKRGAAAQDARRYEPVNALNAAFASAMAKPPPALDEEWYVSIDGEQEGPFSLAEAQHWVTQKPFDAELHCWSEGFDDWLPVDKVSHFRGLRKRPPPAAAPPPLPRIAGVPARAGAATPAPAPVNERSESGGTTDDEPKPLFAATMASLERSAPPLSNPAIALPAAAPARTTPRGGYPIAARGNGVSSAAAPAAAPTAGSAATPAGDARPANPRAGAARPGAANARAKSISDSFSDAFDPTGRDSPTQIEPVPFRDPPAAAKQDRASAPAAVGAGTGATPSVGVPEPPASSDFDDSGELAIGEVSRVVNLTDIARDRDSSTRRSGVNPMLRGTGAIGRAQTGAIGRAQTGAIARAPTGAIGRAPTGAIASMGMSADATPTPDEGELGIAMAPVRKSHRRGLITLLTVAIVMVLGVSGAVVLLVTTEDHPIGGRLRTVHDIDTSRPEDPITHRPLGSAAAPPTPSPVAPRASHSRVAVPNPPSGGAQVPEPLPGNSLSADEVEDVARKHQDMTNRCYMRSQRGADSILIGDVKKISVTLTVDRDGNVSDLKLSEHEADNLGKCLTMSIRGWKFRQSAGGTFRFSLNFVGS
jgi:predicted Zn finger-like uncharacterized protein